MITKEDIAWSAGIYEGEGCCSRGNGISVAQKDTWILYKLQSLFGGSVCDFTKSCRTWRWTLHGNKCREFVKLILPYLSPRRTEQIMHSHILDSIKEFKDFKKKAGIYKPYDRTSNIVISDSSKLIQ